MKKISFLLVLILSVFFINVIPFSTAYAKTQTPITRSQAEARALQIINTSWSYSSSKNSNIDLSSISMVTLPSQFSGVLDAQQTGIPYAWGGNDSIDSASSGESWSNFLDAVSKGAITGNVNTRASSSHVKGTAGLDCSGFVQSVFNIQKDRITTATLFNSYFTKINISDLKHMDILDKPGSHTVVFNKWGNLNGVDGAFTYEATPDQTYGGIQGTKEYFMSMKTINSGYHAGRYINIVDDGSSDQNQAPMPQQTDASQNGSVSPNQQQTQPNTNIQNAVPSPQDQQQATPQNPVISPQSGTQGSSVNPIQTVPAAKETAFPSPYKKGDTAVVSDTYSNTNVRDSAASGSKVIASIPKGSQVILLDYSSGWYLVSYNEITGWIYGNLIKPSVEVSDNAVKQPVVSKTASSKIASSKAADVRAADSKFVTVKNLAKLNIRKTPASSAAVVGSIKKGQKAQVLACSGDGKWYQLSINGVQGWAYREYLK